MLKPRRVRYRFQIAYKGIEGDVFYIPVGQAIASRNIAHEAMMFGKPMQERTPDRTLPVIFKMIEPIAGFYDRRSLADAGIGDIHAIRFGAELNIWVQCRPLTYGVVQSGRNDGACELSSC